jgi:hypothetical protein
MAAGGQLPIREGSEEKMKAEYGKSDAYFAEELPQWNGYIEWEKYPEKKAQAKELLAKYSFPHVS